MSNAGDVPLPPGDDDWDEPAQQQRQRQIPPWWPPYVQPQQQAPLPQPHKVRLAPFWTHNPRVWFTQAESAFNTCFVMEERMKFDLVVAQLQEETLQHVQSIVEAPEMLERPYQVLKLRLLEAYQPDKWELVSRILHFREMGDQKPSQLMDQMLAILPRGEEPGLLFKGIFLDRMPADLRAHVQGAADQQDCRQLAAACDVVWLARSKKSSKVAVVSPDPVEEAVEHVAALGIQPSKRGGGSGSGRSRSRGKSGRGGRGRGEGRQRGKIPGFTCWRHVQYGDQAYHCEDPSLCSFQQQEN